ncbi:MAG: hypothetical protein HEP71_04565 [Roseivirga sp.]|nr:hypothetical protein [Roseivirga sp.]
MDSGPATENTEGFNWSAVGVEVPKEKQPAPLRKWALRLLIYAIITRIATFIIHVRFFLGAFDQADTRLRIVSGYAGIGLFCILAIILSLRADNKEEPPRFLRGLVLYGSFLFLLIEGVQILMKVGVFYTHYW